MKNYVDSGDQSEILTAAAHYSGDVVVINELVGIAQGDALIATQAIIVIEGTFRLPKTTGVAILAGALVNFDASAAEVTSGATAAAGDVTDFAIAMEPALSAATFVNVKLMPGAGTFS